MQHKKYVFDKYFSDVRIAEIAIQFIRRGYADKRYERFYCIGRKGG